MSSEARQRLLKTFLPALVALVSYVWGFAAEPQAKLDALRERLEKLEREPRVSVGAARKGVRALEQEVARARVARREAGKLTAHLSGDPHEDEERHACEESLIELLGRHGILLEGTGEAPGGFVRPPSLEAVRLAARGASREAAPQRRRGRKQTIRRAGSVPSFLFPRRS